ncbi:MAG: DUF2953 domain-containing protein [Lachnospiraceae bacterium]|nr:DUF2953 domain-containing protein [Lachnospiraceae bacterium]
MLEIILLILKIIGIILLAVIGLLLLILLAILFVPVRYKAWGEKNGELRAEGRVTWLLHILRISVVYENGKLSKNGKFLFFKILSGDEDVEKEWNDADDDLIDDLDETEIPPEPENVMPLKSETNGLPEKTPEDEEKEEQETENNTGKTSEDEEKEKQETENNIGSTPLGAPDDKQEEESNTETPPVNDISDKKASEGPLKDKQSKKSKAARDKEAPKEEKTGIVKKIKKLYNIKDDPRAKRFYTVAKKRLKKIIRHILPRKLVGKIKFGTGDPCSTGKLLGAAALLYPIYGEHISVEPVFEDKILEFDLYMRGRIRIFTVGLPLLMTYKNKDLKYLRKKVKKALK